MSSKRSELTTDATPEPGESQPAAPRGVRARRVALRAIYGLFSLVTVMMSLGVVLLLVGKIPDGPYAFAAAATTSWKLLSLGGYLVIFWTAGRSVVAAQWVAVGMATWLMCDLIAPQDASESVASVLVRTAVHTIVFLGPWFLLAPERREFFRLRPRPDRLALLTVVAAWPLLIAWTRLTLHQDFTDQGTIKGAELQFDMVGMALVLGTVGLFAALQPSARRWLLGATALAAGYVGLVALIASPVDLGSPGLLGGLALLLYAGVLGWRTKGTAVPDSAGTAAHDRAQSNLGG